MRKKNPKNSSSFFAALMNHIKPKLSQRSSVESGMSVQSFLSSGSSECNSIPTSPMPPRAHSYPYPLSEIEECKYKASFVRSL